MGDQILPSRGDRPRGAFEAFYGLVTRQHGAGGMRIGQGAFGRCASKPVALAFTIGLGVVAAAPAIATEKPTYTPPKITAARPSGGVANLFHPQAAAPGYHLPGSMGGAAGGAHLPSNMGAPGGAHLPSNMGNAGGAHLPSNMGTPGGAHLPSNMSTPGGAHLPSNVAAAHVPSNTAHLPSHPTGAQYAHGATGTRTTIPGQHNAAAGPAAAGRAGAPQGKAGSFTEAARPGGPGATHFQGANHVAEAPHRMATPAVMRTNRGLVLAGAGRGEAARPYMHPELHANMARDHAEIDHDHAFLLQHRADFHTTRVRDFNEHEMRTWRGGLWHDEWHYGRRGWWWEAGGVWYPYDDPVYPYPLVVAEPVAYDATVATGPDLPPGPDAPPPGAPPEAGGPGAPPPGPGAPPGPATSAGIAPLPAVPAGWFRCSNPNGYYPSVGACGGSWVLVQDAPPG